MSLCVSVFCFFLLLNSIGLRVQIYHNWFILSPLGIWVVSGLGLYEQHSYISWFW